MKQETLPKCPCCQGTGQVTIHSAPFFNVMTMRIEDKDYTYQCDECHGTGKEQHLEEVG